jgi:DNA helicase-2/ATP-dependent DNA helicase PcrA
MLELSEQKQIILDTSGNLLIMGGPGSGKTTIALIKAKDILEKKDLRPIQNVLFLSFARATIARVEEHANIILNSTLKKNIEITTYHSFAWTLLRSHGYLLNSKALRLLLPHEASARLAVIDDKEAEKWHLFYEEGLVHFDLFANLCATLLKQSHAISRLIAASYPVIILDEFQDTNADEWLFIKELGKNSRLISLADPEQRIYDFRGADPARIRQFIMDFKPTIFDFGKENNRSTGTDIVEFGNDLLTGKNRGKNYRDVVYYIYPPRKNNAQLIYLKGYILNTCERLRKSCQDEWSIAILLPTNILMATVSDFLDKRQKLSSGQILPRVPHDVAVETAGPCIAASLIAGLLDDASRKDINLGALSTDLCEHILGRKGTKPPSQADIELSSKLTTYVESGIIKGIAIQRIVNDLEQIKLKCENVLFYGDVATDWIMIRDILASASNDHIKKVAEDAKYLKLLHKGSALNSGLGQLWGQNYNYFGAKDVVLNALTQEHFSTSNKTWKGISVMTIHKAKGKEFDEVIIYEGAFPGQRIVFNPANLDQARINLRVAVTRAKHKATIITPQKNMCCLL